MKVGDKVSVTIQGSEVAQAEVKEVGEGTATLIVPATRVVMAVRTELAPEVAPEPTAPTKEIIVDEVVRETNPDGGSDKVITSSSVPAPNDKTKFEALDPKVQEQITEIVNAQLAAQAAAVQDTAAQEQVTEE